jgi:hypothetical protein
VPSGTPSAPTLRFSVDPSWLYLRLLGIDLLLTTLYIVFHIVADDVTWGPLRPFFDLNADVSIPSWFASIKLFAIAALLYGASAFRQQAVSRGLLTIGALGFLFLSIDESARVHEKITAVARMLEFDWLLIAGQGAWITVYAAFGALLTILYGPALLRLSKRFPREAAIGAAGAVIFIAGAVAVEIVGYTLAPDSAAYRLGVAFEEWFELIGVSTILYGTLLLHLRLAALDEIPAPNRPLPRTS